MKLYLLGLGGHSFSGTQGRGCCLLWLCWVVRGNWSTSVTCSCLFYGLVCLLVYEQFTVEGLQKCSITSHNEGKPWLVFAIKRKCTNCEPWWLLCNYCKHKIHQYYPASLASKIPHTIQHAHGLINTNKSVHTPTWCALTVFSVTLVAVCSYLWVRNLGVPDFVGKL